ncbi:MAG: hypothetical protein LUG16_08225, partial [Candidatus Gastranaerophilales bacterium]|nr:hypothetical protein [Candidatus Gastranaerophilales bacterium]
FEPPYQNLNYNYESLKSIPIKLKIMTPVSTKKNEVYDGQILKFRTLANVKYNKKIILKQNEIITARVETYTTPGMNGIPAQIIVDDFKVKGIDNSNLKSTYIKKGANLSLLVYPIKWALTPIPGAGSLTNFIFGGNAKITRRDTVTLYYYPEWK